MPKYSAKARKLRGQGNHSGPNFIQLFHYVKRSTSYHGLSLAARALLTEIHDRYNGCNNGMIVLSVREAAYELRCHQSTISRAARELDDAGLAQPLQIGAWRGRMATEWRLMWRRCDRQRSPSQQLAGASALRPTATAQAGQETSLRCRTCQEIPRPPASR